ncbi:phage major capsid protein [Anaerovibrio lipolyticus]|uniref:phage major capsid protein n=1 Tax=Anaerovibrio lipolyticus TaxID=82374 RepID=UPI0026EA5821|nr:phage major capsid protein [Anaerovibrio lipolyticus]MBE6105298.1 phage major capsid protein [Anaerovibrio lipolyticus]
MDKINELIEKRAKLWEEAKNFLDTHTDEDGKLSAEDAATYEKMESDVVDMKKSIDRLQRQAVIDRELNKPTSKPIINEPTAGKPLNIRATDEYKQGMLTAMRTRFRTISDVLQEGNDQQGGYLVPEEYDKRLIDVLTEENIMRSLATKITTSGEHKINIAATKPAAAWIEEGEALTFGDATFDQIVMDAYKLHVAIKITEELLYDNAFNLESYIIDQFGKALANAEEEAFLNGDGKGKPAGIFDAEKGGQVNTTTSGNTISADDIITLIYNLKRPYRKSAAFITNDKTLASIRKLKDNNGVYMWQPALTAGEPDRLMGYAVHTSQFAPESATGKPVMAFGDFSYYNIGDRGSRSMQELKELFAGNGMVGYVMKERVDGRLILPEAVQIMKMKGTAANP